MRLMRSAGNQQQMKALLKLDEDKSGKPCNFFYLAVRIVNVLFSYFPAHTVFN